MGSFFFFFFEGWDVGRDRHGLIGGFREGWMWVDERDGGSPVGWYVMIRLLRRE